MVLCAIAVFSKFVELMMHLEGYITLWSLQGPERRAEKRKAKEAKRKAKEAKRKHEID